MTCAQSEALHLNAGFDVAGATPLIRRMRHKSSEKNCGL
jgi:hypothetical protein